jgi:hypothetical protein
MIVTGVILIIIIIIIIIIIMAATMDNWWRKHRKFSAHLWNHMCEVI